MSKIEATENYNQILLYFLQIFKCFLQIRADSLYHLGMPESLILDDNNIPGEGSPLRILRFSPYLVVDHKHGEKPGSNHTPAPTPAVTPAPLTRPAAVSTPSSIPTPVQSSPPNVTSGSTNPAPVAPIPAFPAPIVTHLSLTHACKAVIICLKQEKGNKHILMELNL